MIWLEPSLLTPLSVSICGVYVSFCQSRSEGALLSACYVIFIMGTRSLLMNSNCCVIEGCTGWHGWKGKRTNGCWTRLDLFLYWERVWHRERWGNRPHRPKKQHWKTRERGGGGEARGRGGEGEEGEGGRDREFLPRNIPVATGIPMLPFWASCGHNLVCLPWIIFIHLGLAMVEILTFIHG